MATFLVTTKMNPALRARVERSVHGGRSRTSRRIGRRAVSVGRLALVVGLAAAVYVVIAGWQRDRRELGRAKSELVERVQKERASLGPRDLAAIPRIETWLTRLASADFTEVVADELRVEGALRATLSGPLVYVRGPQGRFGSSAQVAETAVISPKDALLLCLLDPPGSRAEKAVLEKVWIAYAGGAAMEEHTANARRLHEAVVGLPFLAPAWTERVAFAEGRAEVARMSRDFERAPIERAKLAAKADLLLAAIDEPKDGAAPTELDGESPHFVRVALIDVRHDRTLLAARRRVDPSWISSPRKPTHASGLDSCALAFDVYEGVRRR